MKIKSSVHVDGALARSKDEATEYAFDFAAGKVMLVFRDIESYTDQARITLTSEEARDLAEHLRTFARLADGRADAEQDLALGGKV